MKILFFPELNAEIDIGAGTKQIISASLLEGYFDESKLTALAAGVSLAAFRHKTVRIACSCTKSDHVSGFLKKLGQVRGLTLEIANFDEPCLETIAAFDPHMLVAEPGLFVRDELIATYAQSAPVGTVIYLASLNDTVTQQIAKPKRQIIESIDRHGFVPITQSYYGLFYKKTAENKEPAPPLDPALQRRCLFVFGHARSGSSVVSQLINLQPEFLMTYEANWHNVSPHHSPIDQFNSFRATYRRETKKGYYLGYTHPTSATVQDIFSFYLKNYQYFGDKIAVGTREAFWEDYDARIAFDYYTSNFPFANFVLTIRSPLQSLPAINSILGGRVDTHLLMDWWIFTCWQILTFFMVTDRAIILPFHQISTGDFRPLEQLCGRPLHLPTDWINEPGVTTDKDRIDQFWSQQSSELIQFRDEADSVFQQVIAMIDPENGHVRRNLPPHLIEEACAEMKTLHGKFQPLLLSALQEAGS